MTTILTCLKNPATCLRRWNLTGNCDYHCFMNVLKIGLSMLMAGILLLQACDNTEIDSARATIKDPDQIQTSPLVVTNTAPPPVNTIHADQTQFNIGNKSYLFDISNHSVEELRALLQRAEEINQFEKDDYDKLEIVMILHGPDIDWFTQQNYENNRQLVDLAERLDSFEIIDMKVCETAMADRGVSREEVPAFIESVPYSPDEMKRLLREGYINL